MSTGEKRMLLVPTMQLRFRQISGTTTQPRVLQQKFMDRSVCKEDGTPADEYWLDVPLVIDDEKKMD